MATKRKLLSAPAEAEHFETLPATFSKIDGVPVWRCLGAACNAVHTARAARGSGARVVLHKLELIDASSVIVADGGM